VQEAGENCLMRSFMTFTLYQILLGWSKRSMRWAEHGARTGEWEVRNVSFFFLVNVMERELSKI
jgi:hypothetical protein